VIGGKLRGRDWEGKWMCVLLWGVKMAVVGFVVVFVVVVGGSGDGYVNEEVNAVSGFVKAGLRRWSRLDGRGIGKSLAKVQ